MTVCMTTEALVHELASMTCRCGQRKRRGQTVCRRCWMRLPHPLRGPLYQRVGAGYEEAYEAAAAALDARRSG